MTTDTQPVLVDRPADGVALVRINRPEARNALNMATRKALAAAFEGLHDDPSVRAIVLTGNEQAFAAGAEVVAAALEIAGDLARLPPLAVMRIKEAILAGDDASLEAGLMLERKAFQFLFASADKREGMSAFFDKRQPDFKGA